MTSSSTFLLGRGLDGVFADGATTGCFLEGATATETGGCATETGGTTFFVVGGGVGDLLIGGSTTGCFLVVCWTGAGTGTGGTGETALFLVGILLFAAA